MKALLAGVLIFAFGMSEAAENPCAIFGLGQDATISESDGVIICSHKSNGTTVRGAATRLLGMQLLELREIKASQIRLAAAIEAMAAATERLSKTSDELVVSNTKWRKDVLDKAIAEINALPALLAQDRVLVDTLTAVLREELNLEPAIVPSSE